MNSWDFSQAVDHAFQVLDVFNVDDHVNCGLGICGSGFDVADVGFVIADYSCKLLEHAGAVVAKDHQLDRVRAVALALADERGLGPLNGNAPVRFIHQVGDVRTAYRMNGNSLPAGHVTDNGFATNRIATARAIDQQVVIAFDFDG